MSKTTLSTLAPAPLTIERVWDSVLLELHMNKLRLGPGSAAWLLKALHNIMDDNFNTKQELTHEGAIILTVFNEFGYIYIMGAKARFVIKFDVSAKIIEWLEG